MAAVFYGWRLFLEMPMDSPQNIQKEKAVKVMNYVRDEWVIRLPYLDRAVLRMPVLWSGDPKAPKVKTIAADGRRIYANPDYVLSSFRQKPEAFSRTYLHMIFHCLFCHPFQYHELNVTYWDAAADIAVEKAVLDLNLRDYSLDGDGRREAFIGEIRSRAEITAESIYHEMQRDPQWAKSILEQAPLFHRDEHGRWLGGIIDHHETQSRNYGEDDGRNEMRRKWQKIRRRGASNKNAYLKNGGIDTESVVDRIGKVYRDSYDYTEFLRRFAVRCEEVHTDLDSFDYIYYTYGLNLYGNMPLIEYLEYREAKKIRDFVIAIDTSGSCRGRTVQDFLNRTYSIFRHTESFFERMNVHIIQCDCEIHSDVTIRSQAEFENYIRDLKVIGAGGTDFRPVFERVDSLVESGKLKNLRGLLYFTDGIGRFPEEKPDYKTAFVFLDNGQGIPELPPWAEKLVLKREDLEEKKREYQGS